MAMTVYAVFGDPDQAEAAVSQLVSKGIDQRLVSVRSSEPLLEHRLPTSADKEKTRIPTLALLGGIVGAAFGVLLSVATYQWMNLPTGGMPIIPYGPTGIVTFEITAMGAIFGAVITLMLETGLGLDNRPMKEGEADLGEDVADGGVLVCVRCPSDDQAATLGNLMTEFGAEKTKSL
jgi:hypothetical protein